MVRTKVSSEIGKLKRILNHHRRRNGNAHQLASTTINGFMGKKHVKKLNMATGERVDYDGEDVLTIDPGNYEIVGAKNNPIGEDDRTFFEYDVTAAWQRRQIRAVASKTGESYHRTVHTEGTPESGTNGWLKDATLTPLWTGSTNTGRLEFTRKFDLPHNGIEIFYRTVSNQRGSVRCYLTDRGVITIGNNADDPTEDNSFQSYELSYTRDDTGLTIVSNGTKLVLGANNVNTANNPITIEAIFAF